MPAADRWRNGLRYPRVALRSEAPPWATPYEDADCRSARDDSGQKGGCPGRTRPAPAWRSETSASNVLFLRQMPHVRQVEPNYRQESLGRADGCVRVVKAHRLKFLVVADLANLEDTMEFGGKFLGQQPLVDEFQVKQTDGALMLPGNTVDRLQQGQDAVECNSKNG